MALLGFNARFFSLAVRRYGLHFLDLSRHLQATEGIPQEKPDMMTAAFAEGMEKTVTHALGKPTWQEGVHFQPGTRAGAPFIQGYHGAHQAFLADLSVKKVAWEHVPNIILFTSIPPNTEQGGVTVVLFPVPRVAHLWSTVEDIPAQFVINQHTTWIWIGGTITKKGAQYQLVPMLSIAKRTPLLVMFRHGKKVTTHYAPQGVKGYLSRWKVYGNTGYRYTLHVGPPQLIGSYHTMGAADITKEVSKLELARLEVNMGGSATSEYGSDMDDVEDRLMKNNGGWKTLILRTQLTRMKLWKPRPCPTRKMSLSSWATRRRPS